MSASLFMCALVSAGKVDQISQGERKIYIEREEELVLILRGEDDTRGGVSLPTPPLPFPLDSPEGARKGFGSPI